jgi:hypothetical protein
MYYNPFGTVLPASKPKAKSKPQPVARKANDFGDYLKLRASALAGKP